MSDRYFWHGARRIRIPDRLERIDPHIERIFVGAERILISDKHSPAVGIGYLFPALIVCAIASTQHPVGIYLMWASGFLALCGLLLFASSYGVMQFLLTRPRARSRSLWWQVPPARFQGFRWDLTEGARRMYVVSLVGMISTCALTAVVYFGGFDGLALWLAVSAVSFFALGVISAARFQIIAWPLVKPFSRGELPTREVGNLLEIAGVEAGLFVEGDYVWGLAPDAIPVPRELAQHLLTDQEKLAP